MINSFCYSGLPLVAISFTIRKKFSAPTVRVHAVEVVRDVKRKSGIDVAKSYISFQILKMKKGI